MSFPDAAVCLFASEILLGAVVRTLDHLETRRGSKKFGMKRLVPLTAKLFGTLSIL